MNIRAYHRQQRAMAKAQADYDNELPPDYWNDEEDIDEEESNTEKEINK